MKYFIIIISCLLIFPSQLSAQNYVLQKKYNVDSLESILDAHDGKERIIILNLLADYYSYKNIPLALDYLEESNKLASAINYNEGLATIFRIYGHVDFFESNYISALNNYHLALEIFEDLDCYKETAETLLDLATLHYFVTDYEKALDYCKQSLEAYRSTDDNGHIIGTARDTLTVIGGISMAYDGLGEYSRSVENSLTYINLGIRNDFDAVDIMLVTWNCGVEYLLLGEIDSAMAYFKRAMAYPETELNITAQKKRVILWMAHVFSLSGNMEIAVSELKPVLEWYKSTGLYFWAMYTSNHIGFIYYDNNDMERAEKYLTESEDIFSVMLEKNSWYRHDSLKHVVSYGLELYYPLPKKFMKEMMWNHATSTFRHLYLINEKQHDQASTIKYLKMFNAAKDTLNLIRKNKEVTELQVKYESKKKDREIAVLSMDNKNKDTQIMQSRIIMLALGGVLMLLIILVVLYFRHHRLKKEQEYLVLQQKLFRSQMNPHFIFNSLASLQNLMLIDEKEMAGQYFDNFSELLRNILDNSRREWISLEDELNTIRCYLELQRIRFQGKFEYYLLMDDSINPEVHHIPPMLAQPFIENAIEHGFRDLDRKGQLDIEFSLKKEYLIIKVKDNGIGRKKAMQTNYAKKGYHMSMATDITRERIAAISKRSKHKIKFNITDLYDDNEATGTLVMIEIHSKK